MSRPSLARAAASLVCLPVSAGSMRPSRTRVPGRTRGWAMAAPLYPSAVGAVKTFARLAHARRVVRMRAVATSAVREARNGMAFVRRLRGETGLPVKVITGAEEARLIFRAAQHALGLQGGPHLLLDVGG